MDKKRGTRPPRHVKVACFEFLRKLELIPKTAGEVESCRAAGIPAEQVSRWRSGRPIYLDHAFRLARHWGVSLDWWADDEQDASPSQDGEMAEVIRLARRLGAKRALDRLMMMGDEPEVGEPVKSTRPQDADPPSRRATRKRRAGR